MYPITPLLNPKIMTKKYNSENICAMIGCVCIFIFLFFGIVILFWLVGHYVHMKNHTNTTSIDSIANIANIAIGLCLFFIFLILVSVVSLYIIFIHDRSFFYEDQIDMIEDL